jgi:F-type H+-transporting ATPase subunit b
MQALLSNAEFWVVAGVALFFCLIAFLKVPGVAARALDDRAAKIQAALDEAERLREEARGLVASLKARREEAEEQARQMLKDAKAEAKRTEAEAKARLEEQIARRAELADRRIGVAEAQAAADVKAAAVDLAARMAEAVLAARLADAKSDPGVDRAIGQIGDRLQ